MKGTPSSIKIAEWLSQLLRVSQLLAFWPVNCIRGKRDYPHSLYKYLKNNHIEVSDKQSLSLLFYIIQIGLNFIHTYSFSDQWNDGLSHHASPLSYTPFTPLSTPLLPPPLPVLHSLPPPNTTQVRASYKWIPNLRTTAPISGDIRRLCLDTDTGILAVSDRTGWKSNTGSTFQSVTNVHYEGHYTTWMSQECRAVAICEKAEREMLYLKCL